MAKAAKKPKLDTAGLTVLGLDRLIDIALDEAALNVSFKKRLSAALAGISGGDAVAKLVDSRLDALEKARTRIKGQRERLFSKDLESLLATIVKEFGPVDAGMALSRLIRFVFGYEAMADRANDASGRIASIYGQACDAAAELARALKPDEAARVPHLLMPGIGGTDYYGFHTLLATGIAASLPADVLKSWDEMLALKMKIPAASAYLPAIVPVRRAIADARGDIDGHVRIEEALPEGLREPHILAQRLFTAGRFAEALAWVRQPRKARIGFMRRADIFTGRLPMQPDVMRLEAAILDGMKDRTASQAVRWAAFEERLDATILRDYIAKAGDFEEFEALDRAFALIERHADVNASLAFYLAWPRPDLAALYVTRRADIWDGRFSDMLAPAAAALEADHPAAATVLYRAMLDHVLRAGLSDAYADAAQYLSRLSDLAGHVEVEPGQMTHGAYVESLRLKHGRRFGFWNQVA
ncbi:DUF6880 family protein [Pararhizobium antarcticum]|uniref:Uncharacterized protein n=1 Tax=Pararhizobium antarcticum TaxID=1798805 RepID=A0A657LX71_9HYPH|nr:DUF6880 family protein [Pararhizobium antarcticum]OJF90354.1 hypothetical protein AX761_06700 [Rhizobium sp. 58]OJG00584.1 hypothetical protein AX760_10490 [Pararhizobium antarcticum]